MKNRLLFFLLFLAVSLFNFSIIAQQLAFPGAEGFGRYAKGARAVTSPTIYHVTNLNDSGAGSLRDAVSAPGRIVVFDVCGVINLKSRLVFSSNSYIAGQSAPGDGIILYGNGVTFSAANNLIIRYLRVHMGKEYGDSGKDASGIANGTDMIFDHMSITWGLDENFSVNWDSKGTEPSDITIQNSIIGQGIMSHSAGGLIQTNGGVSIIGCLYIDNKTRNPKVKGLNQFINNVVYNWDGGTGYILGDTEASSWAWLQGNYFIGGPNSGSTPFSRATTAFQLYQADNYVDVNQDGVLNGSAAVNSDFGSAGFVADTSSFTGRPQSHPDIAGGILSPQDALNKVISSVGASLPARSAVDAYVINELLTYGTKGAHIVHEKNDSIYNYVGVVSEGTKPTDTDNDGIPDSWEDANGLDKNTASDALATASNGYLNIENYLNGINAPVSDYVRCASNVKMTSRTKNAITFAWTNNAIASDNILVQQSADGSNFSTIATIAGTSTSYTASSLTEEATYYYRLITTKSGLSNSTPSEILKTATEGEPKIPYLSTDPIPGIGDTTRFYTSIDFAWKNETGPWAGTVYYSIYFGKSADNLTKIADSLTDLAYTFNVDGLPMYTPYYWRVDATNTLGTTTGTVWNMKTGSYSFTSTVADIGVDYNGSTSAAAASGVALFSATSYTLNSGMTNEFKYSASNSSVMNTTTSRGVYDNSVNYKFFYLSSDSYYVQGGITSNSSEQEISDLKINGTSSVLDAGAVCYVLYSNVVGFSTSSIIGYEQIELPAVRSGGMGVELSLPAGVKSFRIYRSVTISTIGEDLYQIGAGTSTQTLSGSGSPRIAYLSATMELTSNDDAAPSSDNTIKSATINGKTASVDNINRTISYEFVKGTTLTDFPVTFVLNNSFSSCDFTSGSTYNFGNGPLQMVVTAQDGTQAIYTVSATVSNKLTVGILTASGVALISDSLLLSAFSDYNVQFLTASTTAPSNINTFYNDCDLIVLHSNVSGTNATGLATSAMVGVKPILNLKAYFYSTGRWGWGTPSNTAIGRVSNTVASALQNHPIFNNVSFNSETLTLYGSATTVVNAFQYVTSPFSGANWTTAMNDANHTIATIDGDATKVNIHELSTNNAAKYLMVGLSYEGNSYTLFNPNAVTLLKNAAAYLLNANTYYDYSTNSVVSSIQSNSLDGGLYFTGKYIKNPNRCKVNIYSCLGISMITSEEELISVESLSTGVYIAKTNTSTLKFLYKK